MYIYIIIVIISVILYLCKNNPNYYYYKPANTINIDLSNISAMKKTTMNIQGNEDNIKVSNSILTISMDPGDSGKDRVRNELSIKGVGNNFVIKKGQSGTWGFSVKYNETIDDKVDGSKFYHIAQIKYNENLSGEHKGNTKPIFTIGFKNKQLVVYKNLSSGHIPIGPIDKLVDKWLNVEVTVNNNNNGQVKWKVGDQQGSYNCEDLGDTTDIYLKIGQYRSQSISANDTTSTSYKNIWFG